MVFNDGFAIWSYLLDGDIVCLGLTSFNITTHANDELVQQTLENYYALINETENLKRNNHRHPQQHGGATNDLFLILRPLLSDPIHFGYTRSKMVLDDWITPLVSVDP